MITSTFFSASSLLASSRSFVSIFSTSPDPLVSVYIPFIYSQLILMPSQKVGQSLLVIPAEAGIHCFLIVLDSRLHGNDSFLDFLRNHHSCIFTSFCAGPKAFTASVTCLMTFANRSPSDAETQVKMALFPSTPI